jgi:hypothetical protein
VRPTLWSEEDAGAHNADAELAGAGDGEYEGLPLGLPSLAMIAAVQQASDAT